MSGPHAPRLVELFPREHHCIHKKIFAGEMLMSIRIRHIVAALSVGAVLSSATVIPAHAQLALYAKAKSEGAVVLYVGGPTAPWEEMAKKFEARYPGVKMSITGGFSNVLDKKVDAQIAAGKLEVDTAIFQTIGDYVRWKNEGHLMNFKPVGFDKIDGSF